MDIKVGRAAIEEASKKLSNWGRWGKDDQVGTLNYVTPEDIANAAKLVQTGKVFALGIPLDRQGPQTGLFGGRFNPIHQMLATGTDAIAAARTGTRSATPTTRSISASRARPTGTRSDTSSTRTRPTTGMTRS